MNTEHLQLINDHNTRDAATGRVLAAANFSPNRAYLQHICKQKQSQRVPTKRRTVCAVLESRLSLLTCCHCTQYLILRKPQAKGHAHAHAEARRGTAYLAVTACLPTHLSIHLCTQGLTVLLLIATSWPAHPATPPPCDPRVITR